MDGTVCDQRIGVDFQHHQGSEAGRPGVCGRSLWIFQPAHESLQEGFVLIAGGIGVAPVMSIVNTLADTNDKRPVYVFYGDYNEDTALYQDEFAAAAEKIDLKLFTVLEKPNNEDYPYPGYITSDLMASVLPENYKDLFYFVCGPAPIECEGTEFR
jgi:ferredoxin-NADP reductase